MPHAIASRPAPSAARTSRWFAPAPLAGAIALVLGSPAMAASFTITAPESTARTLGSAAGQTGTVADTGSLNVVGTTVAVTITGNDATLTNLGTLSQSGSGRLIRDNTGVTGLVINNGSATNANALMQTADADVIQMAKTPASVTLNNWGRMVSTNASGGGAQVVDFDAILAGANVVNNFAGGSMVAYEADAVRTGVNGVVVNAGLIRSITSTGSSSDGIDLQTNSGATITNASGGVIEGGRHGITGGAADPTASFVAGITNNAGGVIRGTNGSGINLDGFNARQWVTLTNAGTIVGNGLTGDGDGVDIDSLVAITNSGTIRSLNAFSAIAAGLAYSEGVSVGGGSIANSGTIEGLVAAGNGNARGRGITLAGNDITSGPLTGTREALYGNTTIANAAGGLIRGQSDSAIVVVGPASGFTVTISNNAGATLQGGGASSAAVRTGADRDMLTNAGRIDGSSSGKAIDLGGGDNSLRIVGASAVVLGDIDGGLGGTNTLTIAPGAGNAFGYAGAISNFASVDIQSGTVSFSGVSEYTGTTTIGGGTLVLDGANRLAAAGALKLAGGTLVLLDAAGVDGQTFASVALAASSSIGLNGSALTFLGLGPIASGAMLTIEGFAMSTSVDYAFRVLGDLQGDSAFQALIAATTIDGGAASARFDGVYTDVGAVATVPEPSTVVLLLGGLGLVGVVARRRRSTRRSM